MCPPPHRRWLAAVRLLRARWLCAPYVVQTLRDARLALRPWQVPGPQPPFLPALFDARLLSGALLAAPCTLPCLQELSRRVPLPRLWPSLFTLQQGQHGKPEGRSLKTACWALREKSPARLAPLGLIANLRQAAAGPSLGPQSMEPKLRERSEARPRK